MSSDIHLLNDGSFVTGERAALLLDDERQSHKRTSGEHVDVVKAMISLAENWEAKEAGYRSDGRVADANLANQFVLSLRDSLSRTTTLQPPTPAPPAQPSLGNAGRE